MLNFQMRSCRVNSGTDKDSKFTNKLVVYCTQFGDVPLPEQASGFGTGFPWDAMSDLISNEHAKQNELIIQFSNLTDFAKDRPKLESLPTVTIEMITAEEIEALGLVEEMFSTHWDEYKKLNVFYITRANQLPQYNLPEGVQQIPLVTYPLSDTFLNLPKLPRSKMVAKHVTHVLLSYMDMYQDFTLQFEFKNC